MQLQHFAPSDPTFRTSQQFADELQPLLANSTAPATASVIGQSEQQRDILAITIGQGPKHISLIAGNHADEPVGPETLRHLITHILTHPDQHTQLLNSHTLTIIPHTNPDGEALNQPWINNWPDPIAYLTHAHREPPGRDLEFGYPDHPTLQDGLPSLRIENQHAANYLNQHAPFNLHMSLHGMAVAEGAWFLIERNWIDRTQQLQQHWLELIAQHQLDPFDWDRNGDKGFEYIGPGFSTTPRGQAMRDHFLNDNDPQTAALFHNSSMEYIHAISNDPLCLVTELPLFILKPNNHTDQPPTTPGTPSRYLRFKQSLPKLRLAIEKGATPDQVNEQLGPSTLEPLPLEAAIKLQLHAIQLGLDTIADTASKEGSV